MSLRVAASATVFLLTANVMTSASTNTTPMAIRCGVTEPSTAMTMDDKQRRPGRGRRLQGGHDPNPMNQSRESRSLQVFNALNRRGMPM